MLDEVIEPEMSLHQAYIFGDDFVIHNKQIYFSCDYKELFRHFHKTISLFRI